MGSLNTGNNTYILNLLDDRSNSSSSASALHQFTCISFDTVGTMTGEHRIGGTKDQFGAISSYAFLPIPENFSFGVNPRWTSQDLGMISREMVKAGMNLSGGLQGIEGHDAWEGLKGSLAGGAKLWYNNIAQTLGQDVASLAAGISNENKDAMIKESYKAAGIAINPNKQLYFEGMDFETFSLSFKIAPLNKADNDNFKAYINSLITFALPNLSEGSDLGNNAMSVSGQHYFTYPGLVQVHIKAEGKTLFREGSLAITFVRCTPSSNVHEDGNPISYNLEISFQESVIRTKSNFGTNVVFLSDKNY